MAYEGGTCVDSSPVPTNCSGVASFTNLAITGPAGDRTLSFSATGLTAATSGTITMTAGTTTQLSITTQPSTSAQSGVAFAQQPVVQLRDASGNPVSQTGVTVTAAIATGGGTLGGTLTATTNGSRSAEHTTEPHTRAPRVRPLLLDTNSLTAATSGTITITPGTAT